MKTFNFTLTLAGVDDMTDELQGALLRVGCDDASLWARAGEVRLSFDREAESLGDAMGSAVKDVERAGYAVANVEVEPVSSMCLTPRVRENHAAHISKEG